MDLWAAANLPLLTLPESETGWAVESLLGFLFRGSLFLSQFVLIWLASSRLVLREYGAERLFWNEDASIQFFALLAVGMHAGTTLFVWMLLDAPVRLLDWLAWWPTPFFLTDFVPVRQAGRLVGFGMTAFGLLLFGTKAAQWCLFEPDPRLFRQARRNFWPGLCGYLAAFALAFGLHALDWDGAVRRAVAAPLLDHAPLGLTRNFLAQSDDDEAPGADLPPGGLRTTEPYERPFPPRYMPATVLNYSLHRVMAYLTAFNAAVVAILLVAYGVLRYRRPRLVAASPIVLVCLGLLVFNQVYGFAAAHSAAPVTFLLGLGAFLVVWNSPLLPRRRPKYQFPGLEQYYTKPVPLCPPPAGPHGLLDDDAVLKAHVERLGGKPRIVLVAASGGGIRAMVWLPAVLEGLERDIPGLAARVRVIAGASGGMVGAALYVGDRATAVPGPDVRHRRSRLPRLAHLAAKQALLPVIQSMVLRDMLLNMFSWPWKLVTSERGRELEDQWHLAATDPAGAFQSEAFGLTFADLAAKEARAEIPSLVFTPAAVEDMRRVIVSNLDLGPVAANAYSCSGIELFKLLPGARATLKLKTAARMNASFPVISPAVPLPTLPPRSLMDAGLYENYGVHVLVAWVERHRRFLLDNTSGVAVVQVRAFPLAADYGPVGLGRPTWLGRALAGAVALFADPLHALLRGRGSVGVHRNAVELSAMEAGFAGAADSAGVPAPSDFFRTFIFELDRDVSLNWYLSTVEKHAVAEEYERRAGVAAALGDWLAWRPTPPGPVTS